jgi:hypothetical protein
VHDFLSLPSCKLILISWLRLRSDPAVWLWCQWITKCIQNAI